MKQFCRWMQKIFCNLYFALSWSIKVSIAAQKFAITDCKGSDTTWELRVTLHTLIRTFWAFFRVCDSSDPQELVPWCHKAYKIMFFYFPMF